MSANIDIIRDALGEIAVLSEVENPSAEQGAHGLREMNQMMEEWEEQSEIRIGYSPQTSASATFPCPPFSETAVKTSLAIRLAPGYGATVSIELATKASNAFTGLLRRCLNKDMQEASLRHLPAGENQGFYDITMDR
jgi:hypothetical protein